MAGAPREGLFTDLYELRMAQAYLEHGKTGEAVFDLHVRELPPGRGLLVSAGIQQALERLDRFTFDDDQLAFLSEQGFSDALLDELSTFSFDGHVEAIPEGRLVFPYETVLQVTAPLPAAQLVETLVLNAVHVEMVVATKAARCLLAAGGPGEHPALVDFGARRAHGRDAALSAARSAYLAGFDGTSLVEAARTFDIPCFGTMAHAFIQAFEREAEGLRAFAESFPDGTTLLIDTYDTLSGADQAIEVAQELEAHGGHIGGVRLDSGDLAHLAQEVRAKLDAAGLDEVEIFASGGLDEHRITELLAQQAPVDGFGIGTSLVVSQDAPSLDLVYKLVSYDGQPVTKTSEGKHVLAGRKQVRRHTDAAGQLVGDEITLADEDRDGEPLLQPAVRAADPAKALAAARDRFLDEIARLPAEHRRLVEPTPYPVARSPRLQAADEQAIQRSQGAGLG